MSCKPKKNYKNSKKTIIHYHLTKLNVIIKLVLHIFSSPNCYICGLSARWIQADGWSFQSCDIMREGCSERFQKEEMVMHFKCVIMMGETIDLLVCFFSSFSFYVTVETTLQYLCFMCVGVCGRVYTSASSRWAKNIGAFLCTISAPMESNTNWLFSRTVYNHFALCETEVKQSGQQMFVWFFFGLFLLFTFMIFAC